MYKQTNFIINF